MFVIPTVTDVLNLDELRAGRPDVVAGRLGLDRPVRWVHVSEIPDIAPLLKGGELILTTGIAWPDSDAAVADYVDQLDAANAAGVVIELGRRFPRVPAVVLRAADARQFPVVALSRPVPFVGITEVVHRLIVNAQYQLLEFSDHAHRAFTALSIEGASVQEVLDRASAMTGQPVVLEDLAHRAVAYSAGPAGPAEVLRDWESRSRGASADAESTTTSPHGWLVTPVGPRFQRWGRLVMPSPAQDNPQLAMLLERAAEALALIRLVERDRAGLEQQAHGGLLADLMRGRTADRPAQRARAESLGFPAGRHAFVGLCVASRSADRLDPVVQEGRDRTLAESVSAACRASGLPALASSLQPDQVLVLVAVPRQRTADAAVEQVAQALDAALRARGEGQPTVGAGRVVESFDDVGASLSEARHVVDVMSSSGERAHRAYYRMTDLGLRGLLASMRDDPRFVGFAESQLGPLLAYDARRGTALEQTLRQYLEAGGNKSRLARTGYISRPALYARLATIEAVLGVDLNDADAAAGLLVALEIRSLRASEGQPA